MGCKKSEKSARSEDPEDREQEPYQPTGNFQTDFSELCKEMEMHRPPPVFLRPKRPTSPVQNEHAQAPSVKKGSKEDKKAAAVVQQQTAEPEEETPEEKAVIEQLGFKPKTFAVKNYLDLMKPCVHVDMENSDKQDSVTEVFVKNWRLELPMIRTLGRCFEKLQRLHTITFWRVAADASVISEMAEMLKQLDTVKCLSLESNGHVPEENYAELIRVESNLTKLQLRFNGITDAGAVGIGEQLRGLKDSPSKLVSLDLSSNCVGNVGAVALAEALRTNRTLIHLSLSNNKLTDEGATALAQTCSRFFLTHEEIVERRKLLSIDRRAGASPDRDRDSRQSRHSRPSSSAVTPPASRRGATDRPGSVRSQQEKADKRGKASGAAAGNKGRKDDKSKQEDKAKGKSQKDDQKSKGKSTPAPERDSKGGTLKSGKGKGSRVKVATPQQDPEPELQFDSEHPLLERADTAYAPGFLLVPGNYVLAVLNLSRNQITDKGVQEWKSAVNYQAAYMRKQKVNGTGLLKLMLQGNPFSTEAESYKILEQAMNARDPLRPAGVNAAGAD